MTLEDSKNSPKRAVFSCPRPADLDKIPWLCYSLRFPLIHNFMKKYLFFIAFAFVIFAPNHKAGAETVCSPTPPIGAPQLNIWPISNDGRDCTDYPLLAMRNVTQNSDYVYNSTVSGNAGDILRVRLYVHNGVLDVDQNEAFNVMLAANLPTANGGGTVTANAWADNAAGVDSGSRGGNMNVSLAPDQYLSYISGSALNYGRGPVLLGGFSDNVVSGGASVGNMRGCFQYLHFVTFDVQIKQDETVPTGTVTVNSNIPTSWVISGPDNFSGSGTFGMYTNAKVSGPDYFINVPNISGYKNPVVRPGFNQSLNNGQTINFDVYYEAEEGPTPPPTPTPTPVPPPTPTPTPVPPPAPASCVDNASVDIVDGIAPVLAPGQTETFTLRVHNTGTSWFYHGSYYQFVQRTGLTMNPSYGHISPSMPAGDPSNYREWTFTLTAPAQPGDYTLTMQMVHRAYTELLRNDGTICGAAMDYDRYFGEQANLNFTVGNVPNGTGSISVASNIPTSWVITGPDNFSGTGTNATYANARVSPPDYTAVFPVIAGYNPPVVSPSATQTLNPGQTITFSVSYNLIGVNPPPGPTPPPPAPTVTVDNSTCAIINVKWNDVSWETGYSVWRSTQANTGFTNVSGNLPANTTNHNDSPATNRAYYYFVRTVNTTTGQQTDSKTVGPIMNKTCAANLDGSTKNLISVTDHVTGKTAPYDNSTVINAGDTLTFQVTISNTGTAAANITNILDTPSGNLANLRNVTVNKGSGFVPVSNSGNTINVSGSKGVGGSNWLIRYDMTITSLTSSNAEQLKNCATIRYTDPQGNGEVTKCFGPILVRKGSGGVPVFREVAP
jgi:uncharacterized repeat protein (TIGR01451 family)